MQLDHERLDVYRLACSFLGMVHRSCVRMPKGSAPLADQLQRAASSIVLNISEGVGKQSSADKRRYYLSAKGSANECGGALDAMLEFEFISPAVHKDGKESLVRIVSMLIRLIQSVEKRTSHP